MRITDSNLQGVTTSTQQTGSAASSGTPGREAAGRADLRDDRVQLSNLSSALKSLSSGTPERSARIEQLAAAYHSGNYQVDSSSVSQAMITDAFSA